jgi:crotonobetainyl-CoA:carnitine CoA-transferase CaiB-like acyl-CoA transferase
MTGPLAGIRIIDCSQIVSGPMACQMLGDQGAEVIKVESPGGDPVRSRSFVHVHRRQPRQAGPVS